MARKRTKAERERHMLERVAYHEAGHAVACVKFERKFVRVTIEPGDGSLGHVLHEKFARSFRPDVHVGHKARETIDDHVLIGMAGSAAESRYIGRESWSGAGQDIHDSIALASYLYGNEVLEKYIPFMRARAVELMKARIIWSQVEGVAAALLERKTLTWAEVREVCRSAYLGGLPMPEISINSGVEAEPIA